MKPSSIFFLLTIFPVLIAAQNLQIHYDTGEDRQYFTTTFEMFKSDRYGSTFWFIDFDYNTPETKGISLAYCEIARYLILPYIQGLKLTVQYNDGILIFPTQMEFSGTAYSGASLGPVWLAGISTPIHLGPFALNLDFLLRYEASLDITENQMTFVWYKSMMHQRLLLVGFYDIWTRTGHDGQRELVHLAEPQFWFRLTPHVAIGSELEISKRFESTTSEKTTVNPTLAIKWIF
jgi:hypothetical protein